MQKTRKIWKVALCVVAIALILAAAVTVVSAYYFSQAYLYNSEDGGTKRFRIGMELNTFFDIINTNTAANTPLGIECTDLTGLTEVTEGEKTYYVNNESKPTLKVVKNAEGSEFAYEYVYLSSASWGSASNPYIISKVNHLQNLYVLQNIGYFKNNYYTSADKKSERDIPYFLVCQPDGKAVTIDGRGYDFEYIGNEANPFIGYLGGSFDKTSTTSVNGQTSSQSVIYGITAKSDGNAVDVGLFGHIGYLGDVSTATTNSETGITKFNGAASTVRDLLLYDVTVEVKDKKGWEAVLSAVAHAFSFSSDTSDSSMHETHHIGILAGHVDYATVEYISVYYSNDDIAALDVDLKQKSTNEENATNANFYSVSGIIGYMVGMNSDQATGVITVNGNNNSDISISDGGSGSGGGLLSGEGRGYVTAAEIYEGYHASAEIVKVTTGAEGSETVFYGLLVERRSYSTIYMDSDEDGTTRTTDMMLPDGTPVKYTDDKGSIATMSEKRDLLGRTSAVEEPWTNYVVHDVRTDRGTDEPEYYYYSGSTEDTKVGASAAQVSVTGISMKYASQKKTENDKTTFTRLCTQYERERIGTQITGTQRTDRYYFYDGVFTFALSNATDTIDPTWADTNEDSTSTQDKITVGQKVDEEHVTSEYWTQDGAGLPNSVVAFIKPVKTVSDLQSGKPIFIAYKNGNSYEIVTLAQNSDYKAGNGDNAVTTQKTSLTLAENSLVDVIGASLTNGNLDFTPSSVKTDLASLQKDWTEGNIQVLNLGTIDNTLLSIAELENRYQVNVTATERTQTFENYYKDDGTTLLTQEEVTALQAIAKSDSTGNYYTIESASAIIADSSYGTDFTFFTISGSSTVNLDQLRASVSANNSTYISQEAGNAGATIDAAKAQSAIDERNEQYYDANGTEVSLSDIGTLISVRNGKFYNASGTEVTLASLKTAIETRNATYYTLSGAVITLAQINAINAAIGTINNNYYSLGSSADGTAITDAPAIQTAINTINSKYYWESGVSISSSAPYMQITNSSETATFSQIVTGTYLFKTEDGSAITATSPNSTLKSTLDNLASSSSAYTATKARTFTEFYCFNTRRTSTRIYYEFYKVQNNSMGSVLKNNYTSLFATEAEDRVKSLLGTTSTQNSITYCTYNDVTLPVLYEYNNKYYSSWSRNTGNTYVFDGAGITLINNENGTTALQFTANYTQTFNVIYKNVTKTGITYTWNSYSTDCTSTPTRDGSKTVGNTALWNDKTIESCSFNLWTCGNGSDAIMIERDIVDGTFIRTTTGNGFSFSFYNGSTTTPCSEPTLLSGETFSMGGANRQLYKNGTYLGICIYNIHLDGILLQSTSGGGGTSYSVVNGSYEKQSDCGSSFTKWDIGQTVKVGGVTYNIYRSSDGKLGVRAYNDIIDGVLVQTLTGNGYTYSLKKADGSGTVTGITATGSQPTKSTRTITVSNVTYDLYVIGDKLGVLIENEHLDGIMLKTLTGSGYTYSMLDVDGKTIGSLSATFNASIGAHLDLEKSLNGYTVYKNNGYLGICVENERIDGIMVKTLTGNGYTYSMLNPDGTPSNKSISATFSDSYTANFALEKTLGSYTVYKNGNYLGVCVENEHIDGILLTSSTGKGLVYSLINGSGAKLAELTSTFTNVSSTAHLNVQKTLTVGGKSYVVYMNNGKLGIRAENFVIDGVIVQTQTGTGVDYSLISPTNSKTPLARGLTFTPLTGKTITSNGQTYQVYESSDKHYCVRLANIDLDGYAVANVIVGQETNYKFYDSTNPSGTTLSQAPNALMSIADPTNLKVATITLGDESYQLYVCDGQLGIEIIHFINAQNYYYTFSHPTADNTDTYYLQIMYRDYAFGVDRVGMVVGTNTYVSTASNFNYPLTSLITVNCDNTYCSTQSTVLLNGDGTAYLQYTVNGVTRYLACSTTGGYFNSADSQTDASKLYLFTAEGTYKATIGNEILPLAGTEVKPTENGVKTEFYADKYVLWPNQVYLSSDTTTAAYNPSNKITPDPTYTIKAISSLGNGWINPKAAGESSALGYKDLSKVFSLGDGISTVSMLNLWGGNTGTTLGKNNYVKAPIGSTGEEAYIPTGCVAFRVNKEGNNKIRVIVAVPISELYYGQSGDTMSYTEDYYFGMWKIDEANSTTTYSIGIENCYSAFELPRSTPFDTATSGNLDTINENVNKYINVVWNGETYRAYLNGDQVLVAYAFDANDVGVYLLGSTKACRIVYFSADSTSSSGNDGVIYSQKLGTIDFVYDNGYTVSDDGTTIAGSKGEKILTVRDTQISPVEYKNYYYASLDLLFLNNLSTVKGSFPDINNFLVYIRRVADPENGSATIFLQAKNYVDSGGTDDEDAIYVAMEPYANENVCDTIIKKSIGTVTRTTTVP